MLEALAERESIYRILAQTTPENTCKDYAAYTADPSTRYPTLNRRLILPFQVTQLVDTDNPSLVSYLPFHMSVSMALDWGTLSGLFYGLARSWQVVLGIFDDATVPDAVTEVFSTIGFNLPSQYLTN